MRRFVRDNSLSVVMLLLFAGSFLGQALTGLQQYNQEQRQHGSPPVGMAAYLVSGDFLEATFENWESEFLQMAALLILSAKLMQRGSAQSKDPDGEDEKIRAPGKARPEAPGPLHRGGLVLKVYRHSLSLALGMVFAISFVLHAVHGARKFNEEASAHGEPTLSVWQYGASSRFWFESFQNWQSEFLSVAAVVILSIFLREKDSPESKPVQASHAQTGR